MPNYCTNILVVKGKPEDLKDFKHRVRSDVLDDHTGKPYHLTFDKHVPPPAGLFEQEPVQNELPDWYWWAREHWGTKWNALYPSRPRGSLKSGELSYRFWTAYSPPVPWMDVVAREHPQLRFELRFEIEMGWGSGIMKWRWGRPTKEKLNKAYAG